MRALLMAASTALTIVALEAEAWACSCTMPPPPAEALASATAVFEGRVLSTSVDPAAMRLTARIEVLRHWKGITSSTVDVHTHSVGSMCGFPFVQGEVYLIYASGGPHLSTGLCSRSRSIAEAAEDLAALGPPAGGAAPSAGGGAPPAEEEAPPPPPPTEMARVEPAPIVEEPPAADGEPAHGPSRGGCAGCGGASAMVLGLGMLWPFAGRRRRRR